MGALKNVLWSRPLTHSACGSPMAVPWLPLWGQTIGKDAQVPWPLLDLPPHSWWGSVYGLPPIPLHLVPSLKKWQVWLRGPALEAGSHSLQPGTSRMEETACSSGVSVMPLTEPELSPLHPHPPGGVGL